MWSRLELVIQPNFYSDSPIHVYTRDITTRLSVDFYSLHRIDAVAYALSEVPVFLALSMLFWATCCATSIATKCFSVKHSLVNVRTKSRGGTSHCFRVIIPSARSLRFLRVHHVGAREYDRENFMQVLIAQADFLGKDVSFSIVSIMLTMRMFLILGGGKLMS